MGQQRKSSQKVHPRHRSGKAKDSSETLVHVPRPETLPFSEHEILETLRNNSTIGIAVADQAGHFLLVNEALCRITGYTERELLLRSWNSISRPDEKQSRSALVPIDRKGEHPCDSRECRYFKKDGTEIWLRCSVSPVASKSRSRSLIALVEDITEQRRAFSTDAVKLQQAKEALRASDESYRHIIAASRDWIWEIDTDARYTYASPRCRKFLGYSPEEMIGKTLFEVLPPGEGEFVLQTLAATAAQRTSSGSLISAYIHRDGHKVVVETSVVAVRDASGNLCGYRGVDRDITEQRRAEDTLHEVEAHMRLALESGRMYVFEWNPQTDRRLCSEECRAVFNVPEYPTADTGQKFLERIHPEDRSRYLEAVSRLSVNAETFHTEYRMLLPGSRVCWIEARGRGFFDPQGELVRVVGIAADVTSREESKDELRTLSAYLINAQEEERKRFARDLHDGASQALALIGIEMTEVANATTDTLLNSRLENLYVKLQQVAFDISHLSHEMHPSTLKHLGLSGAVKVLCEEVTHSYGIDVGFTDRTPQQRTSADTSLCLYRVTQEALQNIVKHSGSKQAWVELDRDEDEISVRIRDKGTGFDTRSKKAGLGLISMRERLRLIGGRIAISSRRNVGTKIEAYAPLERRVSERAA
jgi:PAS domain S-box-containing protein